MKIELTPEQYEELVRDKYLDIVINDDNRQYLYFEFQNDMAFNYGEIGQSRISGHDRGFAFDVDGLRKLVPTKPDDPSWHHNYPLCPSCGTYMIYNFECCPKCGQAILWKDFTGDR